MRYLAIPSPSRRDDPRRLRAAKRKNAGTDPATGGCRAGGLPKEKGGATPRAAPSRRRLEPEDGRRSLARACLLSATSSRMPLLVSHAAPLTLLLPLGEGRRASRPPWRTPVDRLPPGPAGMSRPTNERFSFSPSREGPPAGDGRLREHASVVSWKEGPRDATSGVCRRTAFVTESHRHTFPRPCPLSRPARVVSSSNSSLSRICYDSREDRKSPGRISTFCSICRTMTSMCLSLIDTPWRR